MSGYQRARWTDERRAAASVLGRKRHGAPDGFCTIYGIHVPFEHRDPLRHWADWLTYHHGQDEARRMLLELKADNWRDVPRLRRLWEQKKLIHENGKVIADITWEAWRADRANNDRR
jgi:hypothetical protein